MSMRNLLKMNTSAAMRPMATMVRTSMDFLFCIVNSFLPLPAAGGLTTRRRLRYGYHYNPI